LSGRVGLIYPISEGDPYNAVPFSERFLAGGETSHRGFRLKKLGILGIFNDDDFTVTPSGATIRPEEIDGSTVYNVLGGNAMLILNAEYRYSVTDSVGLTAFLDVGQIWRLIDTVDLGNLKYAPGVGVYYTTPVGPIRFDLAYNIDAGINEDTWVPFLTIGYSF
jgi:outer membrane protein insertion porin family